MTILSKPSSDKDNANPGHEKKRVFTDTSARFHVKDTTIVLQASETPFVVDSTFDLSSDAVLVYAETIQVGSKLIQLPGKNLGLFCNKLMITEDAEIDVSGLDGREGIPKISGPKKDVPDDKKKKGDKQGDKGKDDMDNDATDGKDAGNVWLFVQDASVETLKRLRISAFGGRGGKGADSSAEGVPGNDGKAGGNGGNIEVILGSRKMNEAMEVSALRKRAWPMQVRALLDEHFQLVNDTDSAYVSKYCEHLSTILKVQTILSSLQYDNEVGEEVKTAENSINNYLKTVKSPDIDRMIDSTAALSAIEKELTSVKDISAINGILKDGRMQKALAAVSEESELASILENLYEGLMDEVHSAERSLASRCNSIEGEGGQGGRSPNALIPPGKRGASGLRGRVTLQDLNPAGSARYLNATQAFAFPEQCQLLLRQADLAFYSQAPEEIDRAAELYRRIVDRLGFLKFAKFNQSSPRPLVKAYQSLETIAKVTLFSEDTLRSVYNQAKLRLQRLVLGLDMWGHDELWVPRLSVPFYDADLDIGLDLLKEEETLVEEYEKEVVENRATAVHVEKSKSKLSSTLQSLKATITQLEHPNGPLKMAIYHIAAFNPQLKAKRQEIRAILKSLKGKFKEPPINYLKILDGLSTLVDTSMKPSSILKGLKTAAELYKSRKSYKDEKYGELMEDYLIDEIKTLEGSISDLEDGFTTRADHTIELDDPKCIKILASNEKIRELFKEYRNSFPKEVKKELNDALDKYELLVKTRNKAIVELNSCILLLLEAHESVTSLDAQSKSLGEKTLHIDPNLPFIAHWLRRARDVCQFAVMQQLNHQRRAIRFWGLGKDIRSSGSIPVAKSVILRSERQDIHKAFTKCLERYAESVRSSWPLHKNRAGPIYTLTKAQLTELKKLKTIEVGNKKKTEHSVLVAIDPKSPHPFRNYTDIRLRQVRLWLIGADCTPNESGKKLVTASLIQMGDETIQTQHMEDVEFSHDHVQISFEYFADEVLTREQASHAAVHGRQETEDYHYIGASAKYSSIAAIGPFATWKIVLPVNHNTNQGLDISKVEDAFFEFRGTSQSVIDG
ncbi:hypothetical protein FPOA_03657 [Fusarium poae]|uniref:Uncharacterized protein n=1 Tax=Fusarium poae TaxID=36050 RepID=A0A1B8ARE2_FUSPO|nr:hypothetical protein FPOA_03657 [Fusarium poae]